MWNNRTNFPLFVGLKLTLNMIKTSSIPVWNRTYACDREIIFVTRKNNF